jgi:monooxygenase
MLSRVPNFVFTIGYTNASWTLKADLVAEYVCRLLAHMDRNGHRVCTPVDDDPKLVRGPLLDFQAGYVQRALHLFPKGARSAPWKLGMSYANDVVTLRYRNLEDGALTFGS